MKAGKNVHFNESDQSFYAKADGLVNFGLKAINIYTVYEVNEDISMRTGNIDFNGSVIIHGDVPSGFTVKAAGEDRKSTRLNSSHVAISYAVFCLKKQNDPASRGYHRLEKPRYTSQLSGR